VSAFTRHTRLHVALVAACLLALGGGATALAQEPTGGGGSTGGAAFIPPPPPPQRAKIWAGQALAPASAPARVKAVIAAANKIVGKPYRYGGGHRAYTAGALDSGYDCSGSVSFALHGGHFLRSPLPSGDLMDWGRDGPGRWITVYAAGGHAYVVVAGLRFDTGMRDDPSRTGPAWSTKLRKSASYVPRHPRGY
jgi:cell wall-associated NlpC family hydrolase